MTTADFTSDFDHTLTTDQRVFVNCVADVLEHTPGLHYHVLAEPSPNPNVQSSTYATFLIETNPVHDLTVALELSDRHFTIRVNGEPFARPRDQHNSFEHWVDRCCRTVSRLAHPHLRLKQQLFLSSPTSSSLSAANGRRWRRVGEHEHGWAAVLGFLLPFGLSLFFTRQRDRVFQDWYFVDDVPEEPLDDPQ